MYRKCRNWELPTQNRNIIFFYNFSVLPHLTRAQSLIYILCQENVIHLLFPSWRFDSTRLPFFAILRQSRHNIHHDAIKVKKIKTIILKFQTICTFNNNYIFILIIIIVCIFLQDLQIEDELEEYREEISYLMIFIFYIRNSVIAIF